MCWISSCGAVTMEIRFDASDFRNYISNVFTGVHHEVQLGQGIQEWTK